MSSCVLYTALFTLPFALGWELLGDREKVQTVCVGKEFRLPVDSTSRIVTFTPYPDGPKRILLEKTTVKDPRFEWTKDKSLVLKEVSHADQGVYANKLSMGFTYETVRLIVSECIKPYRRNYGETFEHSIPENGSLLEFSHRGAPSEAVPVVLWNRTDPETGDAGRGRLLRGGKVWVAERVTQADQGNYTVRDDNGKVLGRSTLTVRGEQSRNLIREGQITDHDLRYRGIISLSRNGSIYEVVIARLTSRHDGLYEVKDRNGNLVSSTYLHVIDKRGGSWRALLKSVTVPSGMFVSLAGFILFMKRYPNCSLSQLITCFRTHRTLPANPPRVNIQHYSPPSPQPPGHYSYSQQTGTPRKWTPRASPVHTGYAPVTVGSPRAENQDVHRATAGSSPSHNLTVEQAKSNEDEDRISFPVPGASDCLHSSEDCVQFQIKKDGDKGRGNKSQDFFSTLPLDTDTSESCSIYTSKNLNFS
ncbi:uncharacterized protein LOC102792656 isoform X4 [Neolamprologus brichardi]|uniref:uncharacterized protein LOC102792656 isoform X4 n=1 Tax=Neolamprologus brichardi TaxID=32507 RepID=UPI001643D901|nr:uncharacterized protein LOC102792656 isoform X4 [Neolamprologus brichardi]